MSEASDAVLVVVSEETGAISVAIGGMLKRHLSPETLRKILVAELTPEQKEDPKKRKGLLPHKQKTKAERKGKSK